MRIRIDTGDPGDKTFIDLIANDNNHNFVTLWTDKGEYDIPVADLWAAVSAFHTLQMDWDDQ